MFSCKFYKDCDLYEIALEAKRNWAEKMELVGDLGIIFDCELVFDLHKKMHYF